MSHEQSILAEGSLAAAVAEATGVSPLKCYQCGRCAAGCPQNVRGEMDVSPTRIMRLLQLETAFAAEPEAAGQYATRAMSAETPWLCAGCQACTTRCPQGLDIAGAMDAIRQEGLSRKISADTDRVRDIQTLHRTFLEGAMKRGRMHELSMIGKYKMRSGHFLADMVLGAKMFLKGKIHLLPPEKVEMDKVAKAAEELRHDGGQARE